MSDVSHRSAGFGAPPALLGTIYYADSAGQVTTLAPSTSGYVLQTNGVGQAPSWVAPSGGGGGTYPTIRDEGSGVAGSPHSILDFVGGGVTVTDGTGGRAVITIPAPTPTYPTVKDENVAVAGSPHSILDFAGAGVTVTDGGGGRALVTIPGSVATYPTIQDEGSPLAGSPHSILNFVGAGVAVTNGGGGVATVTITAGGGESLDQTYDIGHVVTVDAGAVQLVTDTDALQLKYATAATAGSQKPSGALVLTGSGWKTNATAGAQDVDFRLRTFPVQGASAPTGNLNIDIQVNGGGYSSAAHISSAGEIRAARATGGTTPAFGWTDATTTGLARSATTSPQMVAGGTAVMRWTTTGTVALLDVTPDTTESRNLGSSSLRWNTTYSRQFNSSEDVTVGTTLSAGGDITAGSSGTGGFVGKSLALNQKVETSGNPVLAALTGAAHTGLTASAEVIDIDLALNRIVQRATGAVTTQRAAVLRAPTYSFVGSSTITTASTLSITGAPVAGTNATITNAYALNVETGNTRFGGQTIATPGSDASAPAFAVNGGAAGAYGVSTGNTGGGGAGTELWLITGGVEQVYLRTSQPMVSINGLAFNLGESTTKIYRSAANTISMDISGTERFKLNASGALFGKQAYTTPVTITDGATLSWVASDSNVHEVTLAGTGRTFANPTGLAKGMSGHIFIVQDGTGSRTITTWSSAFDFGAEGTPTLSTGAGKVDVVSWTAISASAIRCSFNKAA